MEFSAIILAGGDAKRMGRDKAWVKFDGEPLVALAVEKARRLGIKQILLSGRAGGDYSALKCPVLFDLEPGFGPLGGIERGLYACQSPLLLVLAMDLPHMSAARLNRMQQSCDRLTGVVPKLHGELQPLAAIYPKRCHTIALAAITRSKYSAREFAAACWRERAVKTIAVSRSKAYAFLNCNRPGDLAHAAANP